MFFVGRYRVSISIFVRFPIIERSMCQYIVFSVYRNNLTFVVLTTSNIDFSFIGFASISTLSISVAMYCSELTLRKPSSPQENISKCVVRSMLRKRFTQRTDNDLDLMFCRCEMLVVVVLLLLLSAAAALCCCCCCSLLLLLLLLLLLFWLCGC